MNEARCRILLLCLLYIRHRKRKEMITKRKYWVHPIFKLKQQQGDWHNLVREMILQDDDTYFTYMRMTPSMFEYLLSKVGPTITKMETHWRKPISPAARLSMTIRYLASGDGFHSILLSYRIGRSTTTCIIRETCEAIWSCLHKEELFTPTTNGWQEIAHEFENKWNFPNCIGALDGKHVSIICPKKAGSTYYNYKGFHSIVLLALVSATYKFLIVDIGAQGRHSDGGIFKNSAMGQRFYNNNMYLPDPSAISNRHNVPYVIVADEAFQLNSFTMRPYPSKNLTKQRIFNYRLSRARRVVENAFGILVTRWRIYQKPLNTSLVTSDAIIKATVCLHNLLMSTSNYCGGNYADQLLANGQIIEAEWRQKYVNSDNYRNKSFGNNNYTR
ncbi:uncharacterized protein LOC112589650 [Harpegnathos saltator]|uniref:uncharacterized protein LOC112589650 n=1 Tax=Harpegnathos saltator TaxID=610380 RepID=UPI000DBEE432|nr:uncharacterized protein LOC112589650 [Harpegnathos saltator]